MVMGEEGGCNCLLFSLHCGNDLFLIYIILEGHQYIISKMNFSSKDQATSLIPHMPSSPPYQLKQTKKNCLPMKNIFLSNEPFFSVLALIPCWRIRLSVQRSIQGLEKSPQVKQCEKQPKLLGQTRNFRIFLPRNPDLPPKSGKKKKLLRCFICLRILRGNREGQIICHRHKVANDFDLPYWAVPKAPSKCHNSKKRQYYCIQNKEMASAFLRQLVDTKKWPYFTYCSNISLEYKQLLELRLCNQSKQFEYNLKNALLRRVTLQSTFLSIL